ncbi:hypothetical protein LINGRAPRIM_LOCUS3192 [Linum grandiflorum]
MGEIDGIHDHRQMETLGLKWISCWVHSRVCKQSHSLDRQGIVETNNFMNIHSLYSLHFL